MMKPMIYVEENACGAAGKNVGKFAGSNFSFQLWLHIARKFVLSLR